MALAMPAWARQAPAADLPGSAAIAARARPPAIPARDFKLADYGARGNGRTDCTAALARAIAACHAAGGGRVIVSRGDFLTGRIRLLSRVNLHLETGARLLFSTAPQAYLPLVRTRWEGIECMNYSPLIYAYRQHDIAITGDGLLDGQAGEENWWRWKNLCGPDRRRLQDDGRRQTPLARRIFGPGHYLRPFFIEPFACRNVLIEGVRIRRSPMWEIHPVYCRNVIVRRVQIVSRGPNNDGCDPDSCRQVLIEHCEFTTGDDCISVKSGRDRDGRRIARPCRDVLIRHSVMHAGHGGLALGSEMSGGIENIWLEDCAMPGPGLNWALRLKSNPQRGGYIRDIHVRRIRAGTIAREGVQATLHYGREARGHHLPRLERVWISDLRCTEARQALQLTGLVNDPLRQFHLERCRFEHSRLPAEIRYTSGLELRDVTVNGRRLKA